MRQDEKPPADDGNLNLSVSRALAFGLALALALMVAGSALGIKNSKKILPQATPLSEIPSGLMRLEPTALMSLGIIVLLATPALRVLVLLAGCLRRRDWLFAAVAAAVLAVLALSLALGRP